MQARSLFAPSSARPSTRALVSASVRQPMRLFAHPSVHPCVRPLAANTQRAALFTQRRYTLQGARTHHQTQRALSMLHKTKFSAQPTSHNAQKLTAQSKERTYGRNAATPSKEHKSGSREAHKTQLTLNSC